MKYFSLLFICLFSFGFLLYEDDSILPYRQNDFIQLERKFGYPPLQPGFNNCFRKKYTGISVALKDAAPIYAIADGTVVNTCDNCQRGFGNFVMMKTEAGLEVRYYHLNELLVQSGQKVMKGTQIGVSGNSGTTIVNGLGISIYQDSVFIDPAPILGIKLD